MNKTTILPDGSAFSTAVIMSKEEAMKLPIKERPICFRLSSKMYHDVWEAIGAASMTFNADAGNKEFDSTAASNIATDLLFKIAEEKESATLLLREILDKIRAVASGEDQVANNDTEALGWITNFIDTFESRKAIEICLDCGFANTDANGKAVNCGCPLVFSPAIHKLKEDHRPPRNGWADGHYICWCFKCMENFQGDKRAVECAECAYEKEPNG